MTKEDKQLLLKDLCARLPYDVLVNYNGQIYVLTEIDPACKDINYITVRIQDVCKLKCAESVMIENIKPYLRSLSNMTNEEREYLESLTNFHATPDVVRDKIDFYLERHLDYRGLIPMGLALEAPNDMYLND